MLHYYRVKLGSPQRVWRVIADDTWEEMVARHGDDLIGEESMNGVLQRLHIPSHIREQINNLLLSMNETNILEVDQKITELHDSVLKGIGLQSDEAPLPDYRPKYKSNIEMALGYYNNVIIPSMFPEETSKVCESPMFRKCFPDLFENDPALIIAPREVDPVEATLHHQTIQTPVTEASPTEMWLPLGRDKGVMIQLKELTAESLEDELVQQREPMYGEWLEAGNVGTVDQFLFEVNRAKVPREPGYKETVKYHCNPNGYVTVSRKDNQGGYSFTSYNPKDYAPFELPEIKGVQLKGSKSVPIPVVIEDREVRSHIEEFLTAHYPDITDQVLAKIEATNPVDKKDIIPDYMQRIITELSRIGDFVSGKSEIYEEGVVETDNVTSHEEVITQARRDNDQRLVVGIQPVEIYEHFQKYLKRCDVEISKTVTPSAYDRGHFENIYQSNRDYIGYQFGNVLAPHLEYQGCRRKFMIDGTEHNVFRVLRNTQDSYRPLATVSFNKGFFNIEMH